MPLKVKAGWFQHIYLVSSVRDYTLTLSAIFVLLSGLEHLTLPPNILWDLFNQLAMRIQIRKMNCLQYFLTILLVRIVWQWEYAMHVRIGDYVTMSKFFFYFSFDRYVQWFVKKSYKTNPLYVRSSKCFECLFNTV